MYDNIQKGIYYRKDHKIGNSFSILFLKISPNTSASNISNLLSGLWTRIQNLEKGIIKDLDINPRRRSSGNLSALIGYGSNVFTLKDIKKQKPSSFNDEWNFIQPDVNGGGPVVNGSSTIYSKEITHNSVIDSHIIIQFIADTEFHTHRALVETWKELYILNNNNSYPIQISNFYTGFHSPDGRNLIGFHDGISNIKSSERLNVITIKSNNIPKEKWLINGSYLSFLRISFNLEAWESLHIDKQEILIGRDKETGCPIVSIDRKGKPIKDSRCPVFGTYDVTEAGNEQFRNLPIYNTKHYARSDITKLLQNSHISKNSPLTIMMGKNSSSNQVFRQGFQFIEPNEFINKFNIGLNFICFQNSLEKIFNLLTYDKNNTAHHSKSNEFNKSFQDFFSVKAAGSFLIPPYKKNEPFPGSNIFIE
ncbi:hypothetical protein BH23THE1_BH23THE1_13020 [soil metagenome]